MRILYCSAHFHLTTRVARFRPKTQGAISDARQQTLAKTISRPSSCSRSTRTAKFKTLRMNPPHAAKRWARKTFRLCLTVYKANSLTRMTWVCYFKKLRRLNPKRANERQPLSCPSSANTHKNKRKSSTAHYPSNKVAQSRSPCLFRAPIIIQKHSVLSNKGRRPLISLRSKFLQQQTASSLTLVSS